MSSNLTPQEAEILRLWGVIRKLENRVHMTDKEEAVFGEIYQAFKRLPPSPPDTPPCSPRIRPYVVECAAEYIRTLLREQK